MDYGFKLDPGEVIQRIIHRHILDLLPTILVSLVLSFAGIGLAYISARFPENLPFPSGINLILIAVMISLAGIIFLVGLFVYQRNVLIFTNVHLVQVEQLALFQRRVSQLSFLRVEDVTGRRVGFLQSLFNYGEVEVQSAGEQNKFTFKNAPNPERLADEALEIHEACVRTRKVDEQLNVETGHGPE